MSKSERSDEAAGTGSLLSRLTTHDLKSIKVAIRRHNVPEPVTPAAVQRNLDDPSDFVLYRREGEGQQSIFDRKGIVVNIEKYLEERIVLKSPLHETEEEPSRRSRSKSYSDHERSADSYRSRRSPSTIPRKDKRSPSKSVNRSSSPGYKKHDGTARASGSSKDVQRDRSPVRLPFKGSKERERSPRNKRENERRDKYSPKRYERNRSRSCSPKKLNYKHALPEKYTARSRVSPKRRSVTPPQARRRSRSRKRSPSPFKRYSRSPYLKKMPPGEDRGKAKRRSTSPPDNLKRRSRSPKKYSRSPHMAESSSHRYKRRSRSPYRRESDHRRQSRSPPKRGYKRTDDEKSYRHHRKSPPSDKNEHDRLHEFDYYSAEGFWIPQQGFLPRGMIPPPMGMPRGMMRPGHPYIIHRPYMHIPPHPYHQFRPRFSTIYNNRPFRPRLSIPSATTSTIVKSTTTVSDSNVAESTPTVVVVEQPPTDTENVESTVDDKE